mgnify:CR=1 FL=1
MTNLTRPESAQFPSDPMALKTGRIGVLLINVGTPESTSYWAMRRYLKEFLSDPRVVDTKGLAWWFILNAIILTRKPAESGRAYAKIWNQERDESPLKTISRGQAEQIGARLSAIETNTGIDVAWAMRYGQPSIAHVLNELHQRGCDRILLFSLYPQYSAATTGTALGKAYETLQAMCWQPSIRTMPAYYDHPRYIEAVAESVREHLTTLSFEPKMILASFHGLPKDFLVKGDPYLYRLEKTGRLLRHALGFGPDKMVLTFQSQTGRKEWHEPFTDKTVVQLAQQGVKNLLVVTPGFAADCVETLEEIAIRASESFRQHGGSNFSHVPCLNRSEASLGLLSSLIVEQLQGWLRRAPPTIERRIEAYQERRHSGSS